MIRSDEMGPEAAMSFPGRQAVHARPALWYAALRHQPVRFVVARAPQGRRQLDAFIYYTDLPADAALILEAYTRRWQREKCWGWAKGVGGLRRSRFRGMARLQWSAYLIGVA